VWLFRVAELFGYDYQTILHFADEVYFSPEIASQWHPQSVCIPFGKYCSGSWLTVTPTRSVLHCMNVVFQSGI
jgi:hypothetical protein